MATSERLSGKVPRIIEGASYGEPRAEARVLRSQSENEN